MKLNNTKMLMRADKLIKAMLPSVGKMAGLYDGFFFDLNQHLAEIEQARKLAGVEETNENGV